MASLKLNCSGRPDEKLPSTGREAEVHRQDPPAPRAAGAPGEYCVTCEYKTCLGASTWHLDMHGECFRSAALTPVVLSRWDAPSVSET